MLNFDAGHYFGATGVHPNELIKRLHDRIFSIHIKDKTSKTAADPDENRPFGKGDTPVGEIFQLIQKEKWPIYCDIELEYDYPETSDAVTEVTKCLDFCKKALINGK
jgi:sugar phosphate isomerase/epimerase